MKDLTQMSPLQAVEYLQQRTGEALAVAYTSLALSIGSILIVVWQASACAR